MSNRLRTLAIALLLALACSAATASTAEQTRIRDVVYGHKLGMALTMDVFQPAHPLGIGVIWVLSSGWVSDYNDIEPWWAAYYTRHGLTVFTVLHGSQPRFTMPEMVQDIQRAVRFIRTHASEYGVDPNRLGIAGSSAGGHLAMMIAAYGGPGDPSAKDPVDRVSSAVQAVACFHPPTDFLNFGNPGVSVLDYRPFHEFWHVFGIPPDATRQQRDAVLRAMSPIYGLTEHSPPTLIVHGDADYLVPMQQAQIVMAKLASLHVPHKLIVRRGGTHIWPHIEDDNNLLAEWLVRYLRKR